MLFVIQKKLHTAAALFFSLLLIGCVANSTLPSQNLASVLTPVDTTKQTNEAESTNKLPTKQNLAPPAKEANLSPAIKNQLVSSDSKDSPAIQAAKKTATPPPNSASSPAQPTDTKVPPPEKTVSKPVPKPELAPKAKPKLVAKAKPNPQKKTSLFGALLKNNQAGKKTKPARNKTKVRIKANIRNGKKGLPGVRLKKLFGIDSNETEEFDEPVRVAGVANLARRGTHGLLLQRKGVRVGCFPRPLLRILKRVERKFGRSPIITSGFRSKRYNRRVGGARRSTHVRCLAADIQVKGVSKWKLAKYLRTLPGRGGVGTYCHTKSVHIDIGTKRAWHHCRRSRKRKSRRSRKKKA